MRTAGRTAGHIFSDIHSNGATFGCNYRIFATEGSPYCGFKGKVTRPGPAGLDAPMSRTLGWGMWSDGVMGVMVFPGVSRHAESDFDVRFTPRGPYIHTPLCHAVSRSCHAVLRRSQIRAQVDLRSPYAPQASYLLLYGGTNQKEGGLDCITMT